MIEYRVWQGKTPSLVEYLITWAILLNSNSVEALNSDISEDRMRSGLEEPPAPPNALRLSQFHVAHHHFSIPQMQEGRNAEAGQALRKLKPGAIAPLPTPSMELPLWVLSIDFYRLNPPMHLPTEELAGPYPD